MKKLTSWFLTSALTASSLATHASAWISQTSSPKELQSAHEAFIKKDLNEMVFQIKSLLAAQPDNASTTQNALELLEKAYEENSSLPADTKLPKELKSLNIAVITRQMPTERDYAFRIFGRSYQQDVVKRLMVTDAKGQVILAKDSSESEWSNNKGEFTYEFELAKYDMKRPPEKGLYLITAEFTSGAQWNGWFILSSDAVSSTPDILYPKAGEVIADSKPNFAWEDYRSGTWQKGSERVLTLIVSNLEGSEPSFFLWKQDPTFTSVAPDKELTAGKYRLNLSYEEKRTFGALSISQVASTLRPFSVQP